MSSPFHRCAGPVAAACLASFLLAFPSLAGAATGKYPPSAAARGFDGGLAGWTATSSSEGRCLPPVLCATVENSFQESGGADGGGYIRSAYTGVAGAMTVAGTTTAVWQSPRFSYAGAGGDAPTAVSFALDRRANVDQFLAVNGNSADYSVRLVDLTASGETFPLVAPSTLAGAGSWTNVRHASIDPHRLAIGHDYRIQITTRYTSGTSAVASGSADYDNVVLSAVRRQGAGAGALSSDRLHDLLRGVTPGAAVLAGKGKRLLVKVKCPRKVGRTCQITAQGMLKKRKPATVRRTVKLRKGKAKLVTLRVKPKARGEVAKRKRLLIRQKVRAGKVTATVYKARKLIRRD